MMLVFQRVRVFLTGAAVRVHPPVQAAVVGDDTAAVTVRWRKRKRKEVMMMMTCS